QSSTYTSQRLRAAGPPCPRIVPIPLARSPPPLYAAVVWPAHVLWSVAAPRLPVQLPLPAPLLGQPFTEPLVVPVPGPALPGLQRRRHGHRVETACPLRMHPRLHLPCPAPACNAQSEQD